MWRKINKSLMNIKLTIEYHGAEYCGWQIQKSDSTIQGELTKSFEILFKNFKINIIGSGRTDTGVHAKGQVASLTLPDNIDLDKTIKSVNAITPKNINIKKYEVVDDSFNARYSAKLRIYKYYISKKYSPFNSSTSWCIDEKLNFTLLSDCSKMLKGEHNFSHLSKNNPMIKNKNCIINDSYWEKQNNTLIYTIKANRFLHHMVRFIVGTSIQVGKGKLDISTFSEMINNNSNSSPFCAPSKGLFLEQVLYD